MSVSRSVAVLVCWTLLLGAAVPPVVAGGTATTAGVGGQAVALAGDVAPRPAAIVTVRANNTTTVVRHRNPDQRDEDGDLAAVRAHLAREMGETIVDCSRAVGVGEFDPCEELNGSYDDALSKYVEVSRETADDGDDGAAREFRRARNDGRQYARTVREFRETHEEYREARANGNTARAREKARELRELSEEADRAGGNLSRSLRNVTRSGTDANAAGRAVDESTENVTRTVEGIEGELFVATETTARVRTPAGSFLDPPVVTGRVTTANGTAVPDTRVGLSLVANGSTENRTRTWTRTNATGHYRLVYRPVTVPTGPGSFAVRLLPALESPYLPSNATVRLRVEQTDADLAVTSSPASAAYGDGFRVRVRVTADDPDGGDVPVERLPVVTRVGEFQIGSGTTGEGGMAVPDGRFPAAIRTGGRTLVVGFEETDRAVSPTTETVGLDVRETATTIEATVRRTTPRSVLVEGRLTTADGRPLNRRAIGVSLAGRSLGTLRTDENGSFEGNLTVPAAVLPVEGSVERTVRVVHTGSGRNLGYTETNVTVTIPSAGAASDLPLDGTTLPLALVALLVAVGGAVVLVRRRGVDAERSGHQEVGSGGTTVPSESGVDPERALEAVREAMDVGDYDLVTTAGYRAVRRALADRVAAGPDATHWEFYGACAAEGIDPERLEAVRRLTERFERVAFAPEDASRSTAAAALAEAEAVLGHPSDGGRDGEDGGDGAGGSTAAGASRHGPS
ncbi:MAG: hypothetical protein V5A62_19290 [Haloarculaceae archaeon]